MDIFNVYATLIAFTVCCANYLTKNIYIYKYVLVLYTLKKFLCIRPNSNNNIMLLKLIQLTAVNYNTLYILVRILK